MRADLSKVCSQHMELATECAKVEYCTWRLEVEEWYQHATGQTRESFERRITSGKLADLK